MEREGEVDRFLGVTVSFGVMVQFFPRHSAGPTCSRGTAPYMAPEILIIGGWPGQSGGYDKEIDMWLDPSIWIQKINEHLKYDMLLFGTS